MPFLNYESVRLISSKGTAAVSSQIGFQGQWNQGAERGTENQFEKEFLKFIWKKSSGQINISKMAQNKATKNEINMFMQK